MKNNNHTKQSQLARLLVPSIIICSLFAAIFCFFVYTTFFVSEFAYVNVNYKHGRITLSSDPGYLLEKPEDISFFTSIMLRFQNLSDTPCITTVHASEGEQQFIVAPGEDQGVIFAKKNAVNTVSMCDQKIEIDLRG